MSSELFVCDIHKKNPKKKSISKKYSQFCEKYVKKLAKYSHIFGSNFFKTPSAPKYFCVFSKLNIIH